MAKNILTLAFTNIKKIHQFLNVLIQIGIHWTKTKYNNNTKKR